jgi:uncharacterized membrane protein YcaP (DUF421 family)
MNFILGLLSGFLVMGSVGGLETGSMSIPQTLLMSTIGFIIAGYLVKKQGIRL